MNDTVIKECLACYVPIGGSSWVVPGGRCCSYECVQELEKAASNEEKGPEETGVNPEKEQPVVASYGCGDIYPAGNCGDILVGEKNILLLCPACATLTHGLPPGIGEIVQINSEVTPVLRPASRVTGIEHPSYYTQGSIDCWDAIIGLKLGYLEGNVLKYLVRYDKKGTPLEDIMKAQQYLGKLHQIVEAKEKSERRAKGTG